MCFSALVEGNLRELERRFGVKIDWDNLEVAYEMRSRYKAASIPSALDTYIIQNARTPQQKRMAELAKSHYKDEVAKVAAKLKKYEQDVKDFEAKIKNGSKAKTVIEGLAKRKETVVRHQEKIESYGKIAESGSSRIFPNYYAPVIVYDGDRKLVRLMRYQLCPKSGKELNSYKYNLFNARRDRLLDSKIWSAVFAHQHAIFPFKRFYENVEGDNGKSKLIYFTPEHGEIMWAAALYERARIKEGELWTFAAITGDPPPEVAATGHDRCPIYIAEKNFDAWLRPDGNQLKSLALLDDLEVTTFEHQAA